MSPTQKSVLISLADQANDEGVCWPSLNTISVRTCLSERAVRKAIRDLEKANLLVCNGRSGGSNYYTITPARGAAPQSLTAVDNSGLTPARGAAPAGNAAPAPDTGTPARGAAPPAPDAGDPGTTCPQNRKEPSLNHHEPSEGDNAPAAPRKKRAAKKSPALDFSRWPSDPSPEVLADWEKVRKAKRAPLTQSAVDLIALDLHKAARHGFGVDYCLKVCCARGWQTVKFDWLKNHEEGEGRSIGPAMFEPERPLLEA